MFIFSPLIIVNLYNDPIIILFSKFVNKNVKINNYFSKIILIFGISDMVRVEKTQIKSKKFICVTVFTFYLCFLASVEAHCT